jgi:hypothetical protein
VKTGCNLSEPSKEGHDSASSVLPDHDDDDDGGDETCRNFNGNLLKSNVRTYLTSHTWKVLQQLHLYNKKFWEELIAYLP